MANRGAFQDGVARLYAVGGIPRGEDNKTFTDVYAFTLAEGARPKAGSVSGLPSIGDAGSGAASGYEVKNLTFRQDDPRSLVWYADAEYAKKSSSTSTTSFGGRVVSRTWGAKTVQRDFIIDVSGNAVRNGAGDPFENVPAQDIILPTIQITAQKTTSPAATIAAYSGTINASEIVVAGIRIPPHAGRITILGRDSEDEAYPFEWEYNIDITTNIIGDDTTLEHKSGSGYDETAEGVELGWDVALLNVGYYYRQDGETLRFYDNPQSNGTRADGSNTGENPPIDPSLLQPSTTPKPLGIDGGDRRDYGGYSLGFQRYRATDWSALHLPQD